jgi:hypothetical protein
MPVSVTGSTTVSGSVAASQSGVWNVGINGTASVKDVDQKDRHPFQQTVYFNMTGGLNNSTNFNKVPAGQRLVITYVSAEFGLAPGGGLSCG